MEEEDDDKSDTGDLLQNSPSIHPSPSSPQQPPQYPLGESTDPSSQGSPDHSPQHLFGDVTHLSPQESPHQSPQHFLEQSSQQSPTESPHHSLEDHLEESINKPHLDFPHHPHVQSGHLSLEESIVHQTPSELPAHSRDAFHPSIKTPHHFIERSTRHSPLESPHHSSEDLESPVTIQSPLQTSYRFQEEKAFPPPLESPHQSLIETQKNPRLESDASNQSPQHLESRGEFTHNSPREVTHQSIEESPHHSPQESAHQSPQEPQHDSLGESSHHSQHSPDHTPKHSPDHPTKHSPQHSPPHFYSSLCLPQHSSINVEKPSSSHGVHEEFEVDQVPHLGHRESILSTILTLISDAANIVLEFLLPSLHTEPTTSAVSKRLPIDNTQEPPRISKRGHVAFTSDHDNTEISTDSLDEVVHGSMKDNKRPRKLSDRFFQLPDRGQPKEYTWREVIYLSYQTLGVVYGDLGTSPLYVYPTINVTNPTEQHYLGILSLIFWTLTLIGVLKYSMIVLQADDHGEGGTFAMYSLLCQHANIGQHQGEINPIEDMDGRRLSHFTKLEEEPKYNRTKAFLENNRKAQQVLLFVVMMATCMIIGDGILTPAISVISAIEGIQTQTPNLSTAVIVIISAIILVLLFLLQRFGTNRVSLLFSPVMAMWFITTPLVGIYNIAKHYPGIFKAVSPAHIVYFFRHNSKEAWQMLGGTVLCITGAEAMYADLGHFNKRSVQIAFCLMVYPSVLLTYSGQTSYLIAHPQDHSQGFFKMIPQRIFWPMFIIATLAAIVASQGLISATFSIIKQSVALDYFPRVKMVHTSDDKEGQIYSPEVNYILMILCLAVVFGFRSSATIGNAFGVAVVFVMLITTCLTSLVMLVIWGCRLVFVIGFFVFFVSVESVYVSSVVTKVPQGGWLPFAVALVVTLIMFSWNLGCQAKYRYEMDNQITKQSFGALLSEVGNVRVPGICFFYTDLMIGVPPIVQHYVSNVRSLHRVLVFTTVRFLPVKTVLPAERFLVGRAGFHGVYRCVARYGYRDTMRIQNNEFLDQFLETLIDYIESDVDSSRRKSILSDQEDISHTRPSIQVDVSTLNQAREDGAVYVMGRGELKVGKNTKFMTRFFVGKIYRFLRANCRSEVSAMDIPYAQYLEIGMLYDI